MLTLQIGKWLEDNSFGTLDLTGSITSNGIYIEKFTVGKTGIAIYSRGNPIERGKLVAQTFDIYSRGTNDVAGYTMLENIIEFVQSTYNSQCSLPDITLAGYTNKKYKNIIVIPTSNIENSGLDANDRVVYVCSFNISYKGE